jgi:hypothetical protein
MNICQIIVDDINSLVIPFLVSNIFFLGKQALSGTVIYTIYYYTRRGAESADWDVMRRTQVLNRTRDESSMTMVNITAIP